MKLPYKNGFTLVELMVAMVVGSIAIASAYASYDVIAKQYEKVKGVTAMQSSSRSIMRMIERDIRMAGFKWRNSKGTITFGSISEPIKITDSGNKCCDAVTVIYDYRDEASKKVERYKIHYEVKPYPSNSKDRNRLYRKRDILFPKARAGNNDVLADYVEDLQFYQDTGLDQSQTSYDGGLSARTLDNRSYYQTFTSGKTGILFRINMGFFAGCCPYQTWSGTALLQIYKGEGLRGNLLSSSTVSVITNAEKITVNSWKVKVPVVAGQKYTFNFKPLKGVPDPYGIAIGVKRYTNGHSNLGGYFDMYFQTYVGQESALVEVNLTLRTKNQYGKDRQFKKKDYYEGNYKINKNDAYKRQEYSSTVLIRNSL